MRRTAVFALIAASAAALSVASPSFAQVVVRVAPPAVIVERPPPPPGRGYVWHRGYWRWDGVRYVWAPGAYVVLPRRHAVWVEGRWVPGPGGWVWREGHWR